MTDPMPQAVRECLNRHDWDDKRIATERDRAIDELADLDIGHWRDAAGNPTDHLSRCKKEQCRTCNGIMFSYMRRDNNR